jgi:4-amino-4-deoxy-L-arabinose transferase-like glycosyltransferase
MLAALWIARSSVAHARAAALAVVLAAIASGALFLAWAIPADAAAGGRLLSEGIGREVVGRALRPMDGHGVPAMAAWAFYPLVIAVGFSPWTAFLPRAIARLGADRSCPAGRGLLVSWLLVPATVFTIAATKLPHYVLPMWPALALTVAMTLDRNAEASRADARWDRLGRWILAATVVVELLVLIGLVVVAPLPALRLPLAVLMAIVIAAAVPLWTSRRRALGRRDAAMWAACCAAAQIAASAWLLPALEPLKPVPRIAEAIRRESPPSERIVSYEIEAPSLVFYSARAPVVPLRSDDHVFAWLRQPGVGVLVTTRSAAERLARRPGNDFSLREIAAASGIDVVKGRRLDLVALRKVEE